MEIWNSFLNASVITKVPIAIVATLLVVMFLLVAALFCDSQSKSSALSKKKESEIKALTKDLEKRYNNLNNIVSEQSVKIKKNEINTEQNRQRQNETETVSKQNFEGQLNEINVIKKENQDNSQKMSEINKECGKLKSKIKQTASETGSVKQQLQRVREEMSNKNPREDAQAKHVINKTANNVIKLLENNDIKGAIKKFDEKQIHMSNNTKDFIAKAFALHVLKKCSEDEKADYISNFVKNFDKNTGSSILSSIKNEDFDSLKETIKNGLEHPSKQKLYNKKRKRIANSNNRNLNSNQKNQYNNAII